MTTYPLSTLAAVVTAQGISAPSYADILESLKASFRSIYGSDSYLDADSQDGQLLAIFASAINDCNNTAIDVYNSFRPGFAAGAGLSSVVKINGLRRLVASNSTANVAVVGQAGTVISNGVVGDSNGKKWNLPTTVTIPPGGTITVTATAQDVGDIRAAAGAITQIVTPTRGWQTVTNAAEATPGAPVETDAALRRRQRVSTSVPAQSVIGGLIGALANLTGVQKWAVYDNDTGSTDGNGIPAHSIAVVVEGGDATEIAQTIARKKTPGTGTAGSVTEIVEDPNGVPVTVHFYTPTAVPITVEVDLTALTGYVSTTGTAIKTAIAAYINSLEIGADVYHSKLFSPANDTGYGETYNITAITLKRGSDPLAASDVAIAFNELATCVVGNISLVVT